MAALSIAAIIFSRTSSPGKVCPKWQEPMCRDVARYVSETRSLRGSQILVAGYAKMELLIAA